MIPFFLPVKPKVATIEIGQDGELRRSCAGDAIWITGVRTRSTAISAEAGGLSPA